MSSPVFLVDSYLKHYNIKTCIHGFLKGKYQDMQNNNGIKYGEVLAE